MKRAYIAALGAALCFSHGAPAAEAVTIQVATAPSIYQKTYEALAGAFEKATPGIRIGLIPAKREDEELVQTTLRAAITGDLPDVLFVSPNLMRPLVDRALAVPLDQVGATPDALERIGLVEGAGAVGTIEGKLYGLPFGVSTPVVAFNAELVRKAGGDPDHFPTTWPATIDLVKRISALEPNTLGGFFEYDNTGNWTYKALVATLGGRMMQPGDRTIDFDSPAGLEAFKILRAFGEAGQGRVDMTRDQARQAFAAGKIGLLVTSSGALPGLEKLSAGAFPLRAAPLPLGSAMGRIPAAGTVMMVLTKDPAKQKAAWAFLSFAAGPEAQTIMGTQTGLLSINRLALANPEQLGRLVAQRPNSQAAIDQLPRLTEWYAFPGSNSLKITAVIKEHLQSVLTLKRTPEDEMTAMKQDVQLLLPN